MRHFTPSLFRFLEELEENNTREWFQANRERYRAEVQEPMLRFIADFAEPLATISRHFVADPRPVGGSMFRIYRDVRFSRDKSPYKTVASAHFRHRDARANVHVPGFYLHLEPGNVFSGSGIWHPDGATLAALRGAIVAHPKKWSAAVTSHGFLALNRLGGDTLSRPPRGYPPDHPLVEDLKRKDFVAFAPLTEADACADGFLETFAATCRSAAEFVAFLTRALDLEF